MSALTELLEGLGLFVGFWAFVLSASVRDRWLVRFESTRGVARAGMVFEAVVSTAIGLGGPMAIAMNV